MKSEVFNIDCMIGMEETPDNFYDLAVVDPPYGIGDFWSGGDQSRIAKARDNGHNWNNEIPSKLYFIELKRVSKNQIIWGWNYYTECLGNSDSLVYWHKKMGAPNYSDGEIAWTSFKHKIKTFQYPAIKENKIRIHPCQKPVKLYEWIFKNYAEEGQKIIDSHLGSGSSRIAAYNYKMDFTGYEIDKDYFDAAEKRFQNHIAQLKIFV